MIFTAIILVCSLSSMPDNCNRNTARDVMQVGNESNDLNTCLMAGKNYIQTEWMRRAPKDDEIIKILCVVKGASL